MNTRQFERWDCEGGPRVSDAKVVARPDLARRARMIARRLYETGYDGMIPAEPHDALCDLADALTTDDPQGSSPDLDTAAAIIESALRQLEGNGPVSGGLADDARVALAPYVLELARLRETVAALTAALEDIAAFDQGGGSIARAALAPGRSGDGT